MKYQEAYSYQLFFMLLTWILSHILFISEKISTILIEPNSGKPFVILNEKPIGAGNIFPEQKTVLHKTTIRMPFEGNAEFECNLKPYDSEEKIEHFIDNGNQFLGTKSWTKPFKVSQLVKVC